MAFVILRTVHQAMRNQNDNQHPDRGRLAGARSFCNGIAEAHYGVGIAKIHTHLRNAAMITGMLDLLGSLRRSAKPNVQIPDTTEMTCMRALIKEAAALEAKDAEIGKLRAALKATAINQHMRLGDNGAAKLNGWSCKLCDGEWEQTEKPAHAEGCLLSVEQDSQHV